MSLKPKMELIDVIGEEALVALAETFGGTRLYIPEAVGPGHDIVKAIGLAAARALAERFSPDVIKVPLARELRAARYRAAGLSYAKIALRLGITETGVEKMFRRLDLNGAR